MEQTNTTTTRPTFLTVLCILTWVGTGILIIINGLAIIGAASLGIDGITTYLGIMILCLALCLIGSIMMWQMKKTGFFIYVLGEIAPLVINFVVFKEVYEAYSKGTNETIGMMIGLAIPVLFSLMYALNLKHMK